MVKVVRDAGGPVEMSEAVAVSAAVVPGGRLTLATMTPVMIADVLNALTIFYTPYLNDLISVFGGSSWTMMKFSELSNITTNSVVGRAGPAAVVANSNYDLFVWNDGGILRLTRGPLWTSDTTRGVGAGTTELVRVEGVWLNAAAITNGPAAQRGTYVGTVRSDAGAAIDWELGGTGAGGDPGFLHVWNCYNRVVVEVLVRDSTNSWTYAVIGVWRAANASTLNRVSYIVGLAEEWIDAEYHGIGSGGFGAVAYSGVGFDSAVLKSGITALFFIGGVGSGIGQMQGRDSENALGFHFFQAIELNNGFGAATFWGDAGIPLILQSGFVVRGKF